VGLDLNGNKEL
jgi:DNA polymerase sigma